VSSLLASYHRGQIWFRELWLDQLRWLIPVDPRGIVLCCGSAVLLAMGLVIAIDGDSLGYLYLGGALVGFLFAQTRMLPVFVWLVFAAGGLWAVSLGGPAGWVEVGYGIALAAVSLTPVADPDRYPPIGSPAFIPQPNLSRISAAAEVSSSTPLLITTLGRLRLLAGDQDLAPALLDKRVLGYLWCWLLAVAIRTPRGSISRSELAAELAPGSNRRTQLERLRRQLWDLQHNLPRPLGALVCAERSLVRLDLEGCDCDLLRLRALLQELSSTALPSAERNVELQASLDAISSERFLPEFDDLARSAQHSRGAGMQAVADVRTWAMQTRMDAARLLARKSRQLTAAKE